MIGRLIVVLLVLASAGARADMYPDASNAKLPDARVNLGVAPHVATNVALAAAATTTYPNGVWRDDFAAGLGAPPLFYRLSALACPINSGNGDNGFAVKSADNKCWLAAFGAEGADVRQWGAWADNATDSAASMQSALTWAVASGGRKLLLPKGTIYVNAALSATLGTDGSLALSGSGADISNIRFGPSFGLTINASASKQSIHLRDFSMLAGGANSGTGINIAAAGGFNYNTQSDISNMTFRGSDGYNATNCWATDFRTNYFSNISFINNNFTGCAGTLANPSTYVGTAIKLEGDPTLNGVVYNIIGNSIVSRAIGLWYGSQIQGVTVTNSNFTGVGYGVYTPATAPGTDQLSVTGNQFGYNIAAIFIQAGVPNTTIQGNLFNTANSGQTGISMGGVFICSITGNTFQASSPTGTTAVYLNVVAGLGCTISGNAISGYAVGLKLDTNAGSNVIKTNNYSSVANHITTTNLSNIITDTMTEPSDGVAYGVTQQLILGVANSGDGHSTVQVASTAAFRTGQLVSVGGAVGSPLLAGGLIDKIQVIDATHLKLMNAGFSGTWTSGGIVSVVP